MSFPRVTRLLKRALEEHVPSANVSRRDIVYAAKNEVFDLDSQEGTNVPEPTIAWVHGGGFVTGSKKGVASHVKVLAGDGFTMVAAEYSKGCGETRGAGQRALGFVAGSPADLKIESLKRP